LPFWRRDGTSAADEKKMEHGWLLDDMPPIADQQRFRDPSLTGFCDYSYSNLLAHVHVLAGHTHVMYG
jgi:hypothetical protein